MEIFGIGPGELILVMLIAFVVLGPERLPAVARQLGRWTRQLRGLSEELTGQLRAEWADAAQDLQAAQNELRDLSGKLSNQVQGAGQELRAALDPARTQVPEPAVGVPPTQADAIQPEAKT